MAVQRTFQAVITVLDRTAAPLRAIQGRLRGLAPATLTVGQNLRLVQDRLRALAESPAMERVGNSVALVGRRFAGLAGTVRGVGFGIAGLAAAAGLSAAGLFSMARATIDQTGALDDMANRLGTSAQNLMQLQHAAMLAGVPTEALGSALERLQKGMADAAAGRNAELAGLFDRLKISLRGANGQVRSAADVMPQLATGFERNTNAAVRTRMAIALFGRAGAPLINMLLGGSDALREQMAEWERLHGSVTPEAVQAQAELGDSMDRVRTATEGVRFAIASRLAPAMTPMLKDFALWISTNREWIATKVHEAVIGLTDAFRELRRQIREGEWDWLIKDLRSVYLAVRGLVRQLGGLRNTMLALITVAVAPLALSLLRLGWVLSVGLVQSLAVAGRALAGLSLILLTTPVGWFLLAATAIAALGLLIYENWEPLKQFFADLWGDIKRLATEAWQAMKPMVDAALELGRVLQGTGRGSNPEQQQLRRDHENNRGGAGGTYDGPALDPDTGLPAYPNALPNLYRPQSYRPGAGAPQNGQVEVLIRAENLPRDLRIDANSRGAVSRPQLDVGYALLGAV